MQALDVLRTCAKDPAALRVFFSILQRTRGVNLLLDAFTDNVQALAEGLTAQIDSSSSALYARHLLEQLALALQGHAMALGVRSGGNVGLDNVLALWCSLRLPGNRSGPDSYLAAPFCFGAASPGHLRAASSMGGSGVCSASEAAILDAVLERELAAIKAGACA